ncbi:MAG: DUF4279 domain-containing protein [Candidatus Sulfotelmatobacter sp.]
MHEYSAALRISAVNLDPTEVTAKLGLKPTQVRINGNPRPGGKSVWDEGMWEYEVWPVGKTAWPSLEEGLEVLLSAFRSRNDPLQQYKRNAHIFLWCGHFSSSFGGGPTFSPQLLKQLGDLGVELYLDTFFSKGEKQEKLTTRRKAIEEGDSSGVAKGHTFSRARKQLKLPSGRSKR